MSWISVCPMGALRVDALSTKPDARRTGAADRVYARLRAGKRRRWPVIGMGVKLTAGLGWNLWRGSLCRAQRNKRIVGRHLGGDLRPGIQQLLRDVYAGHMKHPLIGHGRPINRQLDRLGKCVHVG